MANLKTYQEYVDPTIKPQSLSPYPVWQHQDAMLRFSLSNPYSLLYAEMGTGKTLTALHYLEQFDGLRLIVCPSKPMSVYAEDFETFYPVKPFELYSLDQSHGTAREKYEKMKQLVGRNAVIILTFETASRIPLREFPFTAVVIDEAHRIGSNAGKWSRHLAVELEKVPHRVCMTGTAFDDGYERLYGIYRFLDPLIMRRGYPRSKLFGSYDDFLNNYCITYNLSQNVRVIKGYKNLGQLATLLKPSMFKVTTDEVQELPDLVVRRYSVPLSKETRKAYNELLDDAIIDFSDDAIIAPHILTRMTRLQQLIASGELETEQGERKYFDIRNRLDLLKSLVDEIGSEPVVIFTRFKRDVEQIKHLLGEDRCAMLTGSVNEYAEWDRGDKPYLVANVASGSEGLRMTRSRHIIVWSLGYSLRLYKQMIARVHRHGQEARKVFIHCILSEGTIDEGIYEELKRKTENKGILDKALKGES
jgi:SNF2 family DNA or RNA helicase